MKEQTARSRPFIATRKHHHLEIAEDYTELIAALIEEKGEARTCEIAKNLGVSHVTAIKTLKRLQNEGYIETSPRKPVALTSKGKRLASKSKKRHETLLAFLLALGVPRKVAEVDVEGMEHHISSHTLKAIESFLNRSGIKAPFFDAKGS